VIFMLHPLLGAFALASAVALVLLALLNERWVRTPLAEANEAGVRSYNFTDMSLRNSEAIQAMGMLDGPALADGAAIAILRSTGK